jgi:sarcosine oxidase
VAVDERQGDVGIRVLRPHGGRGLTAGRRLDYRAIVVGLGGIGSAAAYWLSRRLGSDVLGLEQFPLGHEHGASHDYSRIVRLSYHRPDYVRLARRAFETWSQVESEAGETLIHRTGGLDLAPRDAAIGLDDYISAMSECAVPFEHLDASEVMRRWPQWRLTEDCHGLYQSDAGFVDAVRATAAHQRLAGENGALLLDRTPVTAVRWTGGEAEVETVDATYRAEAVVLATDAWTNELLGPLGQRLPLTVTREQVTYVSARDPEAFAPDRFPIWIWMDVPSFYGFPTYGLPGPKIGEDVGGAETTARTRSYDPDPAGLGRAMSFVAEHLPGMVGPEILTRTCLYTMTPDRDFVVDSLPDMPGIRVCLGAAHGFKYTSVLGRILAEQIVDGETPSARDIEAFAIDRPILRMADPPKHFLV